MINKRLLIKNLLSYTDENSFYDKKERLSLSDKLGKAKFLKHICALSNANPHNNSYIVVGVSDENSEIKGVDFFDDSKIQNLVDAYLKNPPKIQYENISFPYLQSHKVVGLVTIQPTEKVTSFQKGIWKYPKNTVFLRKGSISSKVDEISVIKNSNSAIVESIEKNATTNIETILDGVFDFFSRHKKAFHPAYKVFNEQFVLCWSGKQKHRKEQLFYSTVDIELINEQIKLFYSTLDDVKIEFTENQFTITEYISLGFGKKQEYYPLEKTLFSFLPNGKYTIDVEFLFTPPSYPMEELNRFYTYYNHIVVKLKDKSPLTEKELTDLNRLPMVYLLCSLNGILEAKECLFELKEILKSQENKTPYIEYKKAVRILRKLKYQ
ncbi:MAG: ATP-binding protein [Flavobacteriaceae bacterium]|nr:ATP-binding protein [Flavobacteriaceae bacterium]